MAQDVITSLPTSPSVLDAATVISRATAPARTVVETSALSLGDKLEVERILREAGHTALDCPMSGTFLFGCRTDSCSLLGLRGPLPLTGMRAFGVMTTTT